MDIPLRVLIIEDSDRDAALEVRALEAAGYRVTYVVAETATDMKAALADQAFDIVISDHGLPQFDAPGALAVLKESGLDIPFIIVSGAIGEEIAVELMKAGANDYVMKDRLSRLVLAIQKELKEAESRRERKRAEEALRESELRYHLLFEEAQDGIALADEETGEIVDCNQSLCRMTEKDKTELLGQHQSTLHPDQQLINGLSSSFRLHKIEEPGLTLEDNLLSKSGKMIPVEIRTSRLRINGRYCLLGTFRDISNRKRAEEQLQNTLTKLRRAVNTTIQVMVSAVEVRDPYTSGHQKRSANLARAIAKEMGLSQEKIDATQMAGSIHDIGKLSIPAEILSKPTKLSEIELSLIKEHARKGYEMLKDVESPWPLAEIVHQHHERMDGSGYPRNLKGEEICIEARILAMADVMEAMASHRPYRPALGIDAALNEIEKNRGIFYDDTVADACLRLFQEKGFQLGGT